VAAPTHSWVDLEAFVGAYEKHYGEKGPADLASFLPAPQHSLRRAVLRELVRVDLEYGWEDGRKQRVEDYLERFPELREDAKGLTAVAFEEYRSRKRAGEAASPDEFRARLGITTCDWPREESESVPALAAEYLKQRPVVRTFDDVLAELGDADSESADCLVAGAPFLGFELVRELGRGVFGRVYLARQGDLAQRLVVLKLTSDWQGESQALAQLQHTHIVPVYSVHAARPFLALCMPYFGATTLADVLRELRAQPDLPRSGQWLGELLHRRRTAAGDPALTAARLQALAGATYVEAVLALAEQLADALAYAHERGIVHRDLKPANVLLADDGQAMLLDFSLAADLKAQTPAAAYLGGTLPYMAPESLEAFRDQAPGADPRVDLYALGVILHELLTGRAPFPVRDGLLDELLPSMIAERRSQPIDPRHGNRDISPAVASIVRRCLAADPRQRYQSALELHEDLARQRTHRPLRFAPDPSPRERARKWLRRHPRLASVSGVTTLAAILLLALGGAYWNHARRLARSEAVLSLQQFHDRLRTCRFLLSNPAPSAAELQEGATEARAALDQYGLFEQNDWPAGTARTLAPEEREALRADGVEAALLLARATGLQALRAGDDAALHEALHLNALAEAHSDGDASRRPIEFQRATLLHGAGREPEARAHFESAERLPLRTARDYYLVAVEQIGEGDFGKALALLEQAQARDPQDAFIRFAEGLCYAGRGNSSRALACFDTSIALWPRFHGSYYQRGGAYYGLREYDRAVADFSEALRLRPDYVPSLIDRGLARLAQRDYTEAVRDLSDALEKGGAPTRVYFIRARARELAGDVAGARADRARALEMRPEDDLSWVARGVAKLGTDPRGALADFDAALKLNPRCREALQDRAHALSERLGRTQDAIESLDRLLARYPDDVPALAGRGVLRARLGQRAPALDDAAAALRLDTQPAIQYQVAGIYALTSRQEKGDRLEAIRLLTAALRSGYGFDLLASDPDLAPIRSSPEFRRFIESARLLRDPTPH
jgi:serine/threonine protein kinase/tetratricopeptide (TPR) repeat protein